MKKMEAQISVEHLILFGIVLAILIPAVIVFYTNQMENKQSDQAMVLRAGTDLLNNVQEIKQFGSR
jgi:uncharacterized protein (UPF0333 family)